MIGSIVKLGIGAAVIMGVVYLYTSAKQAIQNFGYNIKSYGSPSADGFSIELPIIISFNNPTDVAVNVDNVSAQLYLNKGGSWSKAATVSQPLSVPAGASDQKINAKIDLSAIFGGDFLNTVQALSTIVSNRVIQVRTDVQVTYGQLTFPSQTFTQNISVG